MKIGILYVGIGDYIVFWKDFYSSCEKYLFPDSPKNYLLFTDKSIDIIPENVYVFYQEDLGWPKNVLYRYKMFYSQKQTLEKYDYLFFFNGNTLFKQTIRLNELLPKKEENYLTSLYWHIFYYGKSRIKYTYERNPLSTAYIPYEKGNYYYQAGLIGGKTKNYLHLLEWCQKAVEKDEKMELLL